jgi:ribose transport system substrate-binding protein
MSKTGKIAKLALGLLLAEVSTIAIAADTGDKRIAFSNNFAGNTFRQAMLQSWQRVSSKAVAAHQIKDAPIFTTAQNQVTEQASQIQNLILQGYDAIVVNAASPTGLNGVVKQACAAGIVVVSFDGIVTEPCAYRVTFDYKKLGVDQASFLGSIFPNGANVLEVRGIAGTFIDNDVSAGVHEALGKMPGFKIVGSVYGNWSAVDSQQAVASVLPSIPKIDAVLASGGGTGIIQAFEVAKRPYPLITMGNQYDELAWWQKRRDSSGYLTRSAAANPGITSFAFYVAQQALAGRDMPKDITVPFLTVEQATLDAAIKTTEPGAMAMRDYTLDDVLKSTVAN